MGHHAKYMDDKNNIYHFRVDGSSVYVYADCYQTAVERLQIMYCQDITID